MPYERSTQRVDQSNGYKFKTILTRKVIKVLQKLVGPEVSISSTQISRCEQKLDEGLDAWRNRPLEEAP